MASNIKHQTSKISGLFLIGALLLSGCSESVQQTDVGNTAQDTKQVEQNQDDSFYLVVTDASNAPYELRDANGQVIGFDIDIINAIAQNQGFKIKVLPKKWTGIFNLLDTGEADIVVAPITINEERKKIVDFTIPYIKPTRTAFLLEGNDTKLGVKQFSDIQNVQVAVKDKTTNLSSLQEMFGQDWKNFLPTDTQYLAFRDMVGGKADVAFGDTIVLRYHAESFPDSRFKQFTQPLEEPVLAGFAVKKGNTELALKLNNGIEGIKKDGTYNKIVQKWFDPLSVKEFSE